MNKKKIIGLSLAAAMLWGNAAFAANTVDHQKIGEIVPISSPISIQDKTSLAIAKEIKNEDQLVTYNVQVPKIQGLNDIARQEQLNSIISNQALKDIEEVETQAQEHAIMAEQEGWEIRPYEIFINFEEKTKGEILSFVINTYMYTGGANGITRVDCYNIDTRKGEQMGLKDLFKDNAGYEGVINKEIRALIKEHERDDGVTYFTGENGFKSVSAEQDFYIEDENLVILFQKYDIAPGAMGTPEFEIPITSLNSTWRYNQEAASPSAGHLIPETAPETPIQELIDLTAMRIIVNDKKIDAPRAYANKQNIVMVPLRAISEALEIGVKWNHETKNAILSHDISLTAGQDSYSKAKDVELKLGAAPEIKDNVLFVPLSFFKKVIGMNNAYAFEDQIVVDNNEVME